MSLFSVSLCKFAHDFGEDIQEYITTGVLPAGPWQSDTSYPTLCMVPQWELFQGHSLKEERCLITLMGHVINSVTASI